MSRKLLVAGILVIFFIPVVSALWQDPAVQVFWTAIGVNIEFPNNVSIGQNLNVSGSIFGDGTGITGVIASSDQWNNSNGFLFPNVLDDRVGIGTIEPNDTLQVKGNVTFNQNLKVDGNANITGNATLHIIHGKDPPHACTSSHHGKLWVSPDEGLLFVCEPQRDKWLTTIDQLLFGEETSGCSIGETPNTSIACAVDWGDNLGPGSGTENRNGLYIPHNATITGFAVSIGEIAEGKCEGGLENYSVQVWGGQNSTDHSNYNITAEIRGLFRESENDNNLSIDIPGDRYIMWGIENNCEDSIEAFNVALYYRYRHVSQVT